MRLPRYLIVTLLLFSFSTITQAKQSKKRKYKKRKAQSSWFQLERKKIDVDFQFKVLTNNSEAQKLGQTWESEQLQIYSAVAAFDFKLFQTHRLKVHGFVRQGFSKLYSESYPVPALSFSAYPKIITPRELLKLQHQESGDDSLTYSDFNELSYSWGDDEVTFSAGRMPVVYGEGLVINPINPFNHNSYLATNLSPPQGNDGFSFSIKKSSKHQLNFYFLGDKQFSDYDDQITRTIALHGQWNRTKTFQINYLLSEDQKRHKYGFELKKNLASGLLYLQAVNYSKRLDQLSTESKGLTHFLLGANYEFGTKWIMRIESGKFAQDPVFPLNDPSAHMPLESITALFNTIKINKKWNAELGLLEDQGSGANWYKFSGIYRRNKNIKAFVFFSGLMKPANDDAQYLSQKYIPSETGFSLRVNF